MQSSDTTFLADLGHDAGQESVCFFCHSEAAESSVGCDGEIAVYTHTDFHTLLSIASRLLWQVPMMGYIYIAAL